MIDKTTYASYSRLPDFRQSVFLVILLFALHAVLGIEMYLHERVATAHAYIVAVVAIICVLRRSYLQYVPIVCGYIVGSEVLWRMCRADVFYEVGKYSISGLLVFAMLRDRFTLRVLPIAFFVLLLPSVGLTLGSGNSPAWIRGAISFSMSGPFSIMVCTWYFMNQKIYDESFKRVLLATMIPVISVATITVYATHTATDLMFNVESNHMTSGGFGPNQVSSILGLGVVMCFWYIILQDRKVILRTVVFALLLLFVVQSLLTFSRNGIYLSVLAAGFAMFGMMWGRLAVLKPLLVCSIVLSLVVYWFFPILEAFTGGKIGLRFSEATTTGRAEILLSQIEMWSENPLLGVGPGGTKIYLEGDYAGVSSHTEFSRLVSEHGSLGLMALLVLMYIMFLNYRKANSFYSRAIVLSFLVWGSGYMMVNGMRLVAPSFMIGVTCAVMVGYQRQRYVSYIPVEEETESLGEGQLPEQAGS